MDEAECDISKKVKAAAGKSSKASGTETNGDKEWKTAIGKQKLQKRKQLRLFFIFFLGRSQFYNHQGPRDRVASSAESENGSRWNQCLGGALLDPGPDVQQRFKKSKLSLNP